MFYKYKIIYFLLLAMLFVSPVIAGDCVSEISEVNLNICKDEAKKLFIADNVAGANDVWSKIYEFSINSDDKFLQAESLKYIGNIYLKQHNYNKAEENYNKSLDLVEKGEIKNVGAYNLAADLYYNLANLHLQKKDYYKESMDETLQFINSIIGLVDTAQGIYRSQENIMGDVDCLNLKGKFFYDVLLYKDAEQFYNNALKLIENPQGNYNEEELIKKQIGIKYNLVEIYYDRYQIKKAIKGLEEILVNIQELESGGNSNFYSDVKKRALNKLARIYFEIKNYGEAEKKFNESNDETVLDYDYIRIDNNLGLAEIELLNLNFKMAESLLSKSLASLGISSIDNIQLDKIDNQVVGTITATYGNYYYFNKEFDKSFQSYEKALVAQAKYNLYKEVAITLNNIANTVYYLDSDPADNLMKAKSILKIVSSVQVYDPVAQQVRPMEKELVSVLDELSTLNKPTNAMISAKLYAAGLKILGEKAEKESENKVIIVSILINLGELLFAEGKYNEALSIFEKAKNYAAVLKDDYNLWKIKYKISKVYRAKKEQKQYKEYLNEALTHLKHLQNSNVSPVIASIDAKFSTKLLKPDQFLLVSFYNDYNESLLTDGQLADTQKLELVNNLTQADLYSTQTTFFNNLSTFNDKDIDELVNRWQQNQKLTLKLIKEDNKSEEILSNKNDLNLLLAEITEKISTNPKYAQVKQLLQIKPEEIKTISKVLPANSLMVYPVITDNEARVFVVSSDIAVSNVFDKRKFNGDFDKTIDEVRAVIEEVVSNKDLDRTEELKEKTKLVYDFIFEPVYSHLKDLEAKNIRIDNLIVYPTGKLSLIPFNMLYDGSEYLVEKPYSLVNVNGISLINVANNDRFPNKPSVAAVYEGFSDLPNIQLVIKTMEEIFGKSLIKTEVDKMRSMDSVNILHFASHADFNDANYRDSAILFGNGKSLYLKDIPSLSTALNDALVVLSACETGLSSSENDTSIRSLASQFELAGARTLIASLWQVDDSATAEIINKFYTKLKTDRNPAKALKDAQYEYYSEHTTGFKNSPIAWAPFVIIGDWQY